MPLYIAKSGDLDRCHRCLTDSLTLKDGATQLLIKYKIGALVTQLVCTGSYCNYLVLHVFIRGGERNDLSLGRKNDGGSSLILYLFCPFFKSGGINDLSF